jgi:hypothetical protein
VATAVQIRLGRRQGLQQKVAERVPTWLGGGLDLQIIVFSMFLSASAAGF